MAEHSKTRKSFLNSSRPPMFCPGCSHDKIVRSLDKALIHLGLSPEKVVLVSDIGCSGLFDVFFHTHAFHGLHGRALTYGLGLKMANPDLVVIVTMGDGGLGIGGAHILSICQRNLDLTLLVLNNFNFGMTGGQYSHTTPVDATTSSKFLNKINAPLDICKVAEAAGSSFIARCSAFDSELVTNMADAISHKGFSLVDIWGLCPGRFTKGNRLGPKDIKKKLESLSIYNGVVEENVRGEYCEEYKKHASLSIPPAPLRIEPLHKPPQKKKKAILILGSAGQRIITAGELLCLAALSGNIKATQKNDYDITVLVGPSVSEVILWPDQIGFTGIEQADVVLALSEDGVKRRKQIFSRLTKNSLVIREESVKIPQCQAKVHTCSFKKKKIASQNWALAALTILASEKIGIDLAMLESGVKARFSGKQLESALKTISKMALMRGNHVGNEKMRY